MRASFSKMASHAGRIVPPLVDVDTDKKFFGPPFPADYPHDIQPHALRDFKKGPVKPYPKMQTEEFFDKDYVKDENGDGGQWKAQMDYDNARTKVERAKQQRRVAEKRAEAQAHDVEVAAGKYTDGKASKDKAAKATEEAKHQMEERRQKEKEAEHSIKEAAAANKAKEE